MVSMIQELDLQQTMTPLTEPKCCVNVVYDYEDIGFISLCQVIKGTKDNFHVIYATLRDRRKAFYELLAKCNNYLKQGQFKVQLWLNRTYQLDTQYIQIIIN